MRAILDIVGIILNLYVWVIIIQAILSWLLHFGVLNPRNRLVETIWQTVDQLTEPLLSRIRRILPPFGGMDLSPLALILAIILTERIISYYVYPFVP